MCVKVSTCVGVNVRIHVVVVPPQPGPRRDDFTHPKLLGLTPIEQVCMYV